MVYTAGQYRAIQRSGFFFLRDIQRSVIETVIRNYVCRVRVKENIQSYRQCGRLWQLCTSSSINRNKRVYTCLRAAYLSCFSLFFPNVCFTKSGERKGNQSHKAVLVRMYGCWQN
jgi:hypothetical protein